MTGRAVVTTRLSMVAMKRAREVMTTAQPAEPAPGRAEVLVEGALSNMVISWCLI